MPSKGNAEWKGDLRSGSGTFTAGDTISGDYSFKSRFETVPGPTRAADRGGPRLLLLDGALQRTRRGRHAGGLVKTDATVTLGIVDGAPTITSMRSRRWAACRGSTTTPSWPPPRTRSRTARLQALSGVPEITLEASLA